MGLLIFFLHIEPTVYDFLQTFIKDLSYTFKKVHQFYAKSNNLSNFSDFRFQSLTLQI